MGDPIIHDFLEGTFFVNAERFIAAFLALVFIAFGYYWVRKKRNEPKPQPRVK